MMQDNIKVSITCLTYNHESYIRKTLEGFLMQKTNFQYEVLIHDDASTDDTANIIREYEKKYPNIIKAIYQSENQHSKGIAIQNVFQKPRAKGKYIAFCEGDDYWCDPNKLQMQVDYMEKHPECYMCVHDTLKITEAGESTGQYINGKRKDKDYNIEQIIRAGGGVLFQTSSFLVKPEVVFNRPKSFVFGTVGDYPMAIYAASKNSVHYIGKVMSCYRINAKNSWTERIKKSSGAQLKELKNMITKLREVDEFTNNEYHAAIKTAIGRSLYTYWRLTKQFPKELPIVKSIYLICIYLWYRVWFIVRKI